MTPYAKLWVCWNVLIHLTMYSGAGDVIGLARHHYDDVRQRLAEDVAVFRQQTAVTAAQNSSDVTNGILLAENQTLEHHWQQQQLMQLRSELPAVDSRIAHLRILMDLARSVS